MKMFRCSRCQHLTFFENTQCVQCGARLAFRPERGDMIAFEEVDDGGQFRPLNPDLSDQRWKLCANYVTHEACNWALPADDPNSLCLSCRFTRVIPNLAVPGHLFAWARIEAAKRRLFYTLLELKLPLGPAPADEEAGLSFEFLADLHPAQPILSGHRGGVITLNIAEADDAERERRRHALGEPYRTLIGHLRHEIGHYYWDVLIRDSDRLAEFRDQFGDERADYSQALAKHYAEGPVENWQEQFVSAYSSAHPWEDWAETWAHYLHMVDALSTAADSGVCLQPRRDDLPAMPVPEQPTATTSFDAMLSNWFPLTYVVNNLNRGLGLPDGYPFVLSSPAIAKLRFVHETIAERTRRRAWDRRSPSSSRQPSSPREKPETPTCLSSGISNRRLGDSTKV